MKLASRQDGLYVSTDNKLSNAQQEQAARGILRHLRPGNPADQQLADFLNLGTLAVVTVTAAAAGSFAANQPSAATPAAQASTVRAAHSTRPGTDGTAPTAAAQGTPDGH